MLTTRKFWALLALLGLVCLPTLAQGPALSAKAQPIELLPGVPASTVADSLGLQIQNAGTPVVTRFAGLLKINCSTNLTCSFGSGVLTMTASATSATAWSGITAATNANAGSFIASGNVWDFGAATTFKLPVAAGFTTTTNGIIGYDSTANNWIMGANGVKNINAVIPASISPANNDCVKWTLVGSTLTLNTAGAACGGGSAAFSTLTGGTNTTAAMLVGSGASLAPTGTGTISANQINGTALSGLATGILKNTTATGVPSIAVAGDFPTLNQNTTGTAANLTGCTPSTAGSICYWNGSVWTLLAGNTTTTNYLQETSAGVPSWTTPAGSGTVTTSGSPTSGQAAEFTAATVITGVATVGGGNSYTKSTISSLTQGQVLCADATPKLINCTAGVPGRTVTITSDTIASTDRLDTVTYNSGSAVATAFTSPATLGSNFAMGELNIGAGAVTNTLGAGTFQTTGSATKVLNQGEWCVFNSPDNTNITDRCASGLLTAGANVTLTRSASGVQISAATGGSSSVPFGTDATNTNAYVVTFSPAISSLTAGTLAIMSVTNANSGAATLNASGLGVKNVTRKGTTSTTALTTGDIKANFPYLIEYDGTEWQLLNSSPSIISDDGTNVVHLPNGAVVRWDGTGTSGSFDNHCSGCQISFNINGLGFAVIGDGATNNPTFVPGSVAGQQQALANKFTATAALTAGQTVKIDTANANSVVVGTTTDTGAGIIIGIVENSPGAAGTAFVTLKGQMTSSLLGTGTCAIGNFVIQDTTTNGRVKCTATYTAGTVIGVATTAQATVGSAVNVLVEPR